MISLLKNVGKLAASFAISANTFAAEISYNASVPSLPVLTITESNQDAAGANEIFNLLSDSGVAWEIFKIDSRVFEGGNIVVEESFQGYKTVIFSKVKANDYALQKAGGKNSTLIVKGDAARDILFYLAANPQSRREVEASGVVKFHLSADFVNCSAPLGLLDKPEEVECAINLVSNGKI